MGQAQRATRWIRQPGAWSRRADQHDETRRPEPAGRPPTLSPVVDRLERLTDLVLVLLRDQRPKSLREIASEVPGYPTREGEARRQAFERDKRTLRDGGIEVVAVPIDGPEQMGYVIRPEDYYLPDLDLSPDEQAALNLAVAGVHLGEPTGRDALWRLGLAASVGARPVAELPALPALGVLHGALRARATVTFGYRGDERHVDPALLRFHGGWWYLVGYDRDREARRGGPRRRPGSTPLARPETGPGRAGSNPRDG